MSREEIHPSPLPARSSEQDRATGDILAYPKTGVCYSEEGLWDRDSINIRPLVQTIAANKRIISISAGVGLLLAALISLVQPPVYEGRSVVDVEGVNENFLNMREVDPTADAGNYTVEPFLLTQVQELQSNSLLEEVATKLDLKNRPSYQGRFNRIKKWLGLPTEEVTAQQLAREMTSHLKVRLSGETRLVEILYSDHDPQLAAQVSNTLAQTFIKDTLSRRQQISRAVEQGLADQLGGLKKNLEDSENQLQAYTQQVGLLFTSNNNSAAQEEFLKLQDALVRAQEERIEVESRYRTATSAPQESIPDVLSDDTLREYSVRKPEREWE
jgi:succinoglycan biosynthesis transport protein ExoP